MARVYLEYLGDAVELPIGETVIGRDIGCSLRFNDPSVSRRHLKIVRRLVESLNGKVTRWTLLTRNKAEGTRREACEIKWKTLPDESTPPLFAQKISEQTGVHQVEWRLRN